MSTWIDVSFNEVVRATRAGDRYALVAEARASGNVPVEVFTHRVVDRGFSHVATVADLKELPTTPEAAVAADKTYYRAARVEVVRVSPRLVMEARDEIDGRIALLLRLWSRDQNVDFGGESGKLYEVSS